MSTIREKIIQAYKSQHPFKNIIWFLFLFIAIDFVWKVCFDEGEHGELLSLFGKDYTYLVEPVNSWTAYVVHWIVVHIFGYTDFKIYDTYIFFENSIRLHVVWECTGVKQMIMFAILIILYFGPVKEKLWFIPVCMLILNLINIIRITAIVFITKDGFPDWFIPFNQWYNSRTWDINPQTYYIFYKDWFEFFHKDVFRWLYYNGVMFLLWLWWEEKYNLPYQRNKYYPK